MLIVNIEIIKSKMAAKIHFFMNFHKFRWLRSASATVRHPLIFSLHLLLFYSRGLCCLLRHRLPTSSQLFINCTSREVDHDQSVVFRSTYARTWEYVHALCTYFKPEGIQECPLLILYLFLIILMKFFKLWTKHHFIYIRYVSVYIQPRYFYLIFRSVSAN